MRNIYKLIIAISMVSLFSCEDAYEIKQVGLLEANNAITNVDDVELNLVGVLSYLDNTVEIQFNATYTDEIGIGKDNGGQNLDELALVLTSSSGKAFSIWANGYIALAQVNRMIDAALLITPNPDDTEIPSETVRYENALGQAYAVRAYLHLKLQTYFSSDLTNDAALGVIALDFVPATDEFLPRSSNLEVFTLITNDLVQAENLINNTSATYLSSDVLKAIYARMYAYRGLYDQAEPYASDLLATYPTTSQAAYTNMFTDAGNGDIIFELERTVGDSYETQATAGGGYAGSLFAFAGADLGGSPFLEMGRSLFNKLSTSDVRYGTLVNPTSIIDPAYATSPNYRESDVLLINKYAGSEGIPLMNDLKIFRGVEMLFILAERGANNGSNLLGAATLIKQLRDARFGVAQALPVYANEQEAFADILAERRIELAYEGHRWVDLKRLGQVANVGIDKDPRDCEVTGGCTMSAGDYRFTAPIPLTEMDINGELTQNPNY